MVHGRTAAQAWETDVTLTPPTAEQCAANAEIPGDIQTGYACWYPQVGGYVGKAIAFPAGGCVDVYVWHDGHFPFDGRCQNCSEERQPVEVHHCAPDQFVAFGQFLAGIAELEVTP
jgi:hypothetical protein